MVEFVGQLERREFDEVDLAFIEDKIANSPAGPAYASSYAWVLAERGGPTRARATLDDRHRPPARVRRQLDVRPGRMRRGLRDARRPHAAAALYERLLPYAGRPATAGRAVVSYGAVDRHLGGLAALLGHHDDAVRHLHAAITRNEELGCTVWRLHAQRWLQRIAPDDPAAASLSP